MRPGKRIHHGYDLAAFRATPQADGGTLRRGCLGAESGVTEKQKGNVNTDGKDSDAPYGCHLCLKSMQLGRVFDKLQSVH